MLLGAKIHSALIDLAVAIEPRLYARPVERIGRPALGAIVVALLIGGLVLTGDAGLWALREALPHRTDRP